MTQQTIKIGPDFFRKAKNDYANWEWALVREFQQNGVDADSSSIHWTVEERDGKTHVNVRNNGEEMTDEILFGKLLSLGSSGKDFEGSSTGGFGKAKEILYFCWDSYRIHSGRVAVDGCGGSYTYDRSAWIKGTESHIVIDGHHADDLERQFRSWCQYAQVGCVMFWNGEQVEADMRKGSSRRDLGFGQVYTNKSASYRMVVRMDGMPMFVQPIGLDRCVVVELKGDSDEVLTSNRDALVNKFRWELSAFVTEMSVDKRSALKPRQPRYRHYGGTRLRHRRETTLAPITKDLVGIDLEQGVVEGADGVQFELVSEQPVPEGFESGGPAPDQDIPLPRAAAYTGSSPTVRVRVAIGEEFVIKNETDMVVPTYYLPDCDDFGSYSKKLVRIWGRLMLQMHRTFDREDSFAVGFLFSGDTTMAEHEEGQFGRVYYIAPATLVEQSGTYSKSWKKKWKLTSRNQLIMAAIHEFVHGCGFGQHDEEYAAQLTSCAATVMDRKKDFTWCFK